MTWQVISLRIYLDNCCYNRPYDDQTQLRISLESQAKLHIQDLVNDGKLELAASYALTYENSRNRFDVKRTAITRFLEDNVSIYIDATRAEQAGSIAASIQQTGVKAMDALHTACAIIAHCDYLLTTDDRLLKYHTDRIRIVDPTEFIRILGGENDE